MSKLALVAALALWAAPAHAFIFINGGGGFNKGGRPVSEAIVWTGRTVTFHINTNQAALNGSITPELTSAEFQAAVNSAVAAWANVCGSDIKVVLGGTTTATRDSADSVNSISWDNRTTGEGNSIANTGTLAVAASSTINATDTSAGCDIVVNGEASGTFGINGEAAKIDLVGVLVHEIGHCLGLDHSIEPPTFTSANPILLEASMRASVSAGDLTMRTISQDEIDGMECVNPTGQASRSGRYCTSYHGTSGGAALTGTVSGGPAATRACSGRTSISGLNEKGSGCITSAFAGEGGAAAQGAFALWPLLAALALQLAWRLGRRWLWLALVLLPSGAQAGPELWFARTHASPALFNKAVAISTGEGTFTSIQPAEQAKAFHDLGLSLLLESTPSSAWGPYFRYGLGGKYIQKGLGTAPMTKETKLTGWTAGLAARYATLAVTPMRFFLDLMVGLGPYEMSQTYIETAETSLLKASAMAVEASAFAGAGLAVLPQLSVNLKLGYSFISTNAFAVKSKSGSRFSSFAENQRLAVSGQELKLKRGGLAAMAALEASF